MNNKEPKNPEEKKYQLKRGEDFYIKKVLQETKLKDFMTTPVVSIDVDAPFSQVAEKIGNSSKRHLPVIDQNKKLVGLMSQRDLYKIQPPRKLIDGEWFYDKESLDSIILKSVMIKNPFSMHQENSIGEALLAMVRFRYGCIPIVDKDNVLCGIITQTDILKIAAQIVNE